jgi:hypothetical protein
LKILFNTIIEAITPDATSKRCVRYSASASFLFFCHQLKFQRAGDIPDLVILDNKKCFPESYP